jgi:hypothetical protein
MTTFTSITPASATLSGSGTLGFTPASHATLTGSGTLMASPSRLVGGVLIHEAYVEASGTGSLAPSPHLIRAGSANLAGSGTLRFGDGASARLPAFASQSADYAYGGVSGTLPALTSTSHDPLLLPNYGSVTAALPALYGAAAGLTGTIGQATATLPGFTGQASDRPYGAAAGTLPRFIGLAAALPADLAYLGETLVQYDYMTATATVAATLDATAALTTTLDRQRTVSGEINSQVTRQATQAVQADLLAALPTTLQVVLDFARDGLPIAWVVNTDSRDYRGNPIYPSSLYDAFAFSSLIKWQGRYFGAKGDGIFELIGDNDAGEKIVSQVMLNKDDYGSPMLKRMQYVYAGVATATPLTVTVTLDDASRYSYPLPATAALQNARAVLGRGLRARWWQLTFTNPDGGDFTLANAEALAELTDRRLP